MAGAKASRGETEHCVSPPRAIWTQRISCRREFISTVQNSSCGRCARRAQSTAATSRARKRRRRAGAGASATRRPSSSAAMTRAARAALIPDSSSSSPGPARRNEGRPRERRRQASNSSRAPSTTRSSSASASPAAPSLRILSACRMSPLQCSGYANGLRRNGSQCRTPKTGARSGNARYSQKAIARLEPRAEGEERLDLVVRLAQPRREGANERPEELVGEVLVEEHQLLQIGFLDRVQRARHLRGRIGAAGRIVDQRHLAEVAAGLEDRQRLLAYSGHHLGDS